MKKLMKKLGLLLTVTAVAVTSVFGLTACGEEKDPDVLYVATNAEFAPFEYLENGKPTGFDIDLANALAKEMGYKKGAKILDMKFEAIIGSVNAGQADIAIAGMTIDPERQVEFSNPYFDAAQVVIYKDKEVKTFNNEQELINFLNNKKIGVCLAYSGQKLIDGYIKDKKITGATVQTSDNGQMAVAELVGGTVDVVVLDKVPSGNIVKANGNADLKITTQTLGSEQYGVVCKKGNKTMLNKVNAALKKLNENKVTPDSDFTSMELIWAKYFKTK